MGDCARRYVYDYFDILEILNYLGYMGNGD